MSERDPFRPPEDPTAPLELASRSPRPPSTTDWNAPPPPNLSPRRYRIPRSSLVVAVVVIFALVGMMGTGVFLLRRFKSNLLETKLGRATDSPVERKGTHYTALDMGDAVLITIEVAPRSAQLLLDGEPLPSNPVRLPRGQVLHRLTALADGYQGTGQAFVADQAKTLRVRLLKAR